MIPKWEYLTLTSPTLEEQNDAGANGWELIGITGTSYVYRRMKQ